MKILIVNDDGYKCKGLKTLAETLNKKHDVIVVAPDGERSGSSHSLTFHRYLKIREIAYYDYPCTTLDGTPCDCVKYGLLNNGMDFDVVLSGINTTCNIATDNVYSGTANAASEAAIMGFKAIAVSADVVDDDYSYVAEFIDMNLETLMELSHDEYFVNVNFPSSKREDIKGWEFTTCGVRRFDDYYDVSEEGSWLKGSPRPSQNPEDSDIECIARGMISISVLRMKYSSDKNVNKKVKLCW